MVWRPCTSYTIYSFVGNLLTLRAFWPRKDKYSTELKLESSWFLKKIWWHPKSACVYLCVCAIEAHRAVTGRAAQISSCDSDVIEGGCLSVQLYILPDPKLTFHWRNHELIWRRDRKRHFVTHNEDSTEHYRTSEKNWLLTLVISSGDAVLHFAIEPRVFITGSESPDPRTWLALSHFKGSLIGSGESGCYIIHI